MVGDGQIVVDGLRAADKLLFCTGQQCIVGKLADGIHGVISADIDEDLNLQLVQKLEDSFVNFLILVDLRQLVAAGAQECGGSSLQKREVQLILDIIGEIDILLIHETLDAVAHAVNLVVASFHGGLEYAGKAGVDDSGGATGLSYDNITLHVFIPSFHVSRHAAEYV